MHDDGDKAGRGHVQTAILFVQGHDYEGEGKHAFAVEKSLLTSLIMRA